MAQEQVNTILQVLQNSMNQMEAKRQYADALALRQQEAQERKLEFEERKRQAQVQEKANQKLAELRQAEFDRQTAEFEARQALQYSQTGQVPAGAAMIPGVTPTLGQPLVHQDVAQSQLVFPNLQEGKPAHILSALTPENYAVQQGRMQTLINMPVEEAKFRTAVRTAQMEHGFKLNELESSQAAARELESMRGNIQLQIARIRATSGDLEDIPGLNDIIQGGLIGSVSQEDLRKKFTLKQVSSINQYAAEQGAQFLPQEKINKLNALETMGDLLPKIREMLNLRLLHPMAVNNPFHQYGQQYAALIKDIRARAPQASVALSGVRRFTQSELERFDELFIPDKAIGVSSPEANLIKYNSFKSTLDQAIQQITKGLNPSQKKAIQSNLQSKGLIYAEPAEETEQKPTGGKIIRWKLNPKTGQLEQEK